MERCRISATKTPSIPNVGRLSSCLEYITASAPGPTPPAPLSYHSPQCRSRRSSHLTSFFVSCLTVLFVVMLSVVVPWWLRFSTFRVDRVFVQARRSPGRSLTARSSEASPPALPLTRWDYCTNDGVFSFIVSFAFRQRAVVPSRPPLSVFVLRICTVHRSHTGNTC